MWMKSSPKYRFFRVMIRGEMIDIDIFQYSHETTVVMSMLYYKQEHIIMTTVSATERKSALKRAFILFQQIKLNYENKLLPL